MLPLLIQDNLLLAYLGLSVFYLTITRVYLELTDNVKSKGNKMIIDICYLEHLISRTSQDQKWNRILIHLFYLSLFGCVVLIFISTMCIPPPNLPYLFELLVAAYSCIHFIIFFVYFNVRQFMNTVE